MSRFSEVGSMAPHGGRKLLKFLILFENSSLLFFPGQFLSGRVLVELEDETPVLGESSFAILLSQYAVHTQRDDECAVQQSSIPRDSHNNSIYARRRRRRR